VTRWLGRIILISIFGALLLTPLAAQAVETLSPEALSIANKLNCPVCEGLSVRDSTSQLSGQMRQEIQNRLDEGQTPQQIINYFVSVYGVSILRDPPKHGFILTLWWGPVIGIVVGLILLGAFLLQKRMRMTRTGASGGAVFAGASAIDRDLESYEARFLRELDADEQNSYAGPHTERPSAREGGQAAGPAARRVRDTARYDRGEQSARSRASDPVDADVRTKS